MKKDLVKNIRHKQKQKQLFYNEIADEFDLIMNKYDLNKRLKIIFKDLINKQIAGCKLLDAGCGTGNFSREAIIKGAKVISMDISSRLIKITHNKCHNKVVRGDVLNLPFKNDSFDIVLSTEVIEHTLNPGKAIAEMARVLKRNGILILTTPNKVWYPAIYLATKLKLRPYEGVENWISPNEAKRNIINSGLYIEKSYGFNLFPYFSPIVYPILDYFDHYGIFFEKIMMNFFIKARKK